MVEGSIQSEYLIVNWGECGRIGSLSKPSFWRRLPNGKKMVTRKIRDDGNERGIILYGYKFRPVFAGPR